MKKILFLLVLLAAPFCRSDDVVVLTEKPVAEYSLPDGSVLKNAFVWRRSSEGLMIVHDDGQYFLNFKLLPDDWKVAYLGESEDEGIVAVVEPSLVVKDSYKLAPELYVVPELSGEGVKWLLRKDADAESRQIALAIILFNRLAKGDREKAKRYFLILDELGYEVDAIKLEKIFSECSTCVGKGDCKQVCPDCEGSGECAECEGAGLNKAALGKSKAPCKVCEGSRECAACEGEKKRVQPCFICRGRGQLLNRQYCAVHRDRLVRWVNITVGLAEEGSLLHDEVTGVETVFVTLPDLESEAMEFYLSDDYAGAMDTNILVACVMQTMLKEKMQVADRFNLMVEAYFPKNKLLKIDDYISICTVCKGEGEIEEECTNCKKEKKKGRCPECTGSGNRKKELGARGECEVCEGTGKCAVCKGDGMTIRRCDICNGRGRNFESMRAEIKLEILVNKLNDYYSMVQEKREMPDTPEGIGSPSDTEGAL